MMVGLTKKTLSVAGLFLIARLGYAQAGAIDSTFNSGIGGDGNIYRMALQDDGKIVVAGAFSSFNGVNRHRVARLNPDGSLDTSFEPDAAFEHIRAIAFDAEGRLLAGGYGGGLVRYFQDGAIDGAFTSGVGSGVVWIGPYPERRIIVGGVWSPPTPRI
jgi:uncharacterized delta-60 repeat protein